MAPHRGIALVTGKSVEPTAVPFRVHIEPAAHVLFGTNPDRTGLHHSRAIHRGWHLAEDVSTNTDAATNLLAALRASASDTSLSRDDRRHMATAVDVLNALNPPVLAMVVGSALRPGPPPGPNKAGFINTRRPST